MIELLLILLYAAYAGVIWRLRGGAYATLTGSDPGTQFTRMVCAWFLACPLAPLIGGWFVLVALNIFAGLAMTGWEEFEGMGTETGNLLTEKPKYWMRWLPSALGFVPGTIPYDLLGMAQAGVFCMLPVVIAFGLIPPGPTWPDMLACLAAGLGFAPCYLLARLKFPTIPRFAEAQAWGEVFTGALIGAALAFSAFHSAGWRW